MGLLVGDEVVTSGGTHPSSFHLGCSTSGGSIGSTEDLLDLELATTSSSEAPLLDFLLATISEMVLLFDLELELPTIPEILLLLLFDLELDPLAISEVALLLLVLLDLELPSIADTVLLPLLLFTLELPTTSDTGEVHPSSSHPGASTAGGSIGFTGAFPDFELATISPMDSVPLLDFGLVPPTIPETVLLLFDLELEPLTVAEVIPLLLLLLFFEPLTTSEMVLLLFFDLELVPTPSIGSIVLPLDDVEDFIAAILLLLLLDFDELPPMLAMLDVPLSK